MNWTKNDKNFTYRETGSDFLTEYYKTYDSNIQNLHNYYYSTSTLTFNGEEYSGDRQIRDKFRSLSNSIEHNVHQTSFQPLEKNKIIVCVMGNISVNCDKILSMETDNKQKFGPITKPENYDYMETFILLNKNGLWFIQSHVFQS